MAAHSNAGAHKDLESHMLGTLYGNCIGDAIGLLTEFMGKQEAKSYYGKKANHPGLEYELKVSDMHRQRWEVGDWTDDSDQMILILDSILDTNGEVNAVEYAKKLLDWIRHGFQELGDYGGLGIGATTYKVVQHRQFTGNPHEAARAIWEKSGCYVAPNGGVMRTSILGVYQYQDLAKVKQNTLEICKVTHADPRCQASCVAVTCAIALMLQRDPKIYKKNKYDVEALLQAAFEEARTCFQGLDNERGYVQELHDNMYATELKALKLGEHEKIGYTYKTLGAGFWALKQNDFRKALTAIVMEAGDADTNGAVAGALLGCKLGHTALPESWLYQLQHKEWLDTRIRKFLTFAFPDLTLNIVPEPTAAKGHLEQHMLGTLYGHCMGDAIGLLTEFMTKDEAKKHYQRKNDKGEVELSYDQKVLDRHRSAFDYRDWTDDTDQMILIIDSILAMNGEVNPVEYGRRLKAWAQQGFPELGDKGGAGLGATTYEVLRHERFDREPHQAAEDIWNRTGCVIAPNGAVMRTSVLGVYCYNSSREVKRHTLRISRVTHADPRCGASCVAVTSAISNMLRRTPIHYKDGSYDVDRIIEDAFIAGVSFLKDEKHGKWKEDLRKHMYAKKLADLKLDDKGKIGYTFKALGAGFWALRQNDFKRAITDIVMEAGDADTNAAVAGALLGCKLGYQHLEQLAPDWLFQLKHKDWFDQKLRRFMEMAFPALPISILPSKKEEVGPPQKVSNLDSGHGPSQPSSQNAPAQEEHTKAPAGQRSNGKEIAPVHSSRRPAEAMDMS